VVELVGSLLVGPLLDRKGARLALRIGPVLYLAAALLFLGSSGPLAVGTARVLQGLGIALILPAAYAVIPNLFSPRVRGTALGAFGVFPNLGLAIGPPLGLWLLGRGAAALFVTAALAAGLGVAFSALLRVGDPPPQRRDRLFTYRAAWTPLYLLTFLTVIYWGVVTAYLPIHVPSSQVSAVGWFFSADALGVLACRVPAGYLADRFGPRWLFLGGIGVLVGSIGLILLPASVWTLALAGCGTGASAALLIPPSLIELQKRSGEHDRGTAMALWTTSFAGAIGVGSLAAAPLVQQVSFEAAMGLSAVLALGAVPIALKVVSAREDG
jgi:MFS family permease